jgi:hypothetical protein
VNPQPVIIYSLIIRFLLEAACCGSKVSDRNWGNLMIKVRILAVGLGATAFLAIAMTLGVPSPANAKPEYAAQTKLPCSQCHQNPAGGGKLKSFGEKFKANGYKLSK